MSDIQAQAIRLASSLPKGSKERTALLKVLAAEAKHRQSKRLSEAKQASGRVAFGGTIPNLLKQLEAEPEEADYIKSELSDYGINVIRDYSRDKGWTRRDTETMLREELKRIRQLRLTPDYEGLVGYARARRSGSEYPLNRSVRFAVFAQLVGKGLIR